MRTIYVCQAGRHYCIDGIYWGIDAEGMLMYLQAKGVSPNEIEKALEGVAQVGGRVPHPATVRSVDGDRRRDADRFPPCPSRRSGQIVTQAPAWR